ncbi:CoA ester lyase [Nocardia uniformis]|uniref:CoA ester lyase n=1 Tax=Nocardia uniformis TaxID=53432 RepID=A0A849BUB9_9NOCA|nr:CoA ester lyase [Nocardia uniformis]NNH68456.1 CoA ester lyase [Nocardia uniformis]
MRSALYVPGNRPELFDKALNGPADVILLDLEDAIPLCDKESARIEVARWLRTVPDRQRPIWVRVNPGEVGEADLRAVALPAVTALCLAKVESAQQVRSISAQLDEYEPRPGAISICPLLESARALYAAPEIASAPRVLRLQLGEADLCADLGITPGPDRHELLPLRVQVVMASAAAAIDPPLAPVDTNFRDLDSLRATTAALRRLGFQGRACIHPAQLPVVNEVFTPSPDELDRARALIARFESAAGGVVLDDSGRMVDLAVIRQARRVLSA